MDDVRQALHRRTETIRRLGSDHPAWAELTKEEGRRADPMKERVQRVLKEAERRDGEATDRERMDAQQHKAAMAKEQQESARKPIKDAVRMLRRELVGAGFERGVSAATASLTEHEFSKMRQMAAVPLKSRNGFEDVGGSLDELGRARRGVLLGAGGRAEGWPPLGSAPGAAGPEAELAEQARFVPLRGGPGVQSDAASPRGPPG